MLKNKYYTSAKEEKGKYVITTEYNDSDSIRLIVEKNGFCSVELCGSIKNYDIMEKNMTRDILIDILSASNIAELILSHSTISEGAYYKAKEYIESNNIDEELSDNYTLSCDYSDDLVSFYVRSKFYDDSFGITICKDGTFFPIISTDNINYTKEAKEARLSFIKEFIYDVLRIKINFGTIDGVNKLKIPELYNRALDYTMCPDTYDAIYKDDEDLIYRNSGIKI